MIPVRTPFFLPYFYPSLIWRIPSPAKALYLTFDDGPVAGPTEFVLDTLSQYGCEATFFCIGDNVRKNPNVFRRILTAGHTVANHTYNHLNGWRTPIRDYVENIQQCASEIKKHSNGQVAEGKMFFRPPYGKITVREIGALRNYRIVMWDVLTKDFNAAISPENCLRNSIAATRNGSIIVFHDSFKAEKNMSYVLPRFIQHFREKGFEFKTLHA
jgi:peptidoglycan-N-acetylglucosamine deacetylase